VNGWRRLPIPLAPAQHETLASWLHRLATVHGLSSADLRQHLRVGPRVTDAGEVHALAGRLAAVTGHPAGGLALALPELRVPAPDWRSLRHLAQRACPRCTARHEGGPVRRLFTHHEYLCSRHGYWLGPPDPTRDDPPPQLATRLPELVTAQHRLRDAMVQYGWAALFDATVGATRICLDLRFSAHSRPLWTRWEQRLDLLMPAGYRRSLFMAAIFPEVAALAALICSPPWRAPAALSHSADVERFLCAAAHELDCPDTVGGLADAIMTWAATPGYGAAAGAGVHLPANQPRRRRSPARHRRAATGRTGHHAPIRPGPARTARHGPGGADALRPPACNSWRRRREAELIPKVHERGGLSGLRGLLHYLFGPGKNNERGGRHDNPHVIAAWAYATCGNLADLQPPFTPNGRPEVGRLTGLLTQPARICVNLASLPVWSVVSVCRSVRLLAQHGRQTFLRSSTCLTVAAGRWSHSPARDAVPRLARGRSLTHIPI